MTKIKIELEIDLLQKDETAALSNLIQVLSKNENAGVKEIPVQKPKAEAEETTKSEEPAKPKKTKKKKPTKAEEVKAEEDAPETDGEEVTGGEEVSFSDIRALMASKLQEGGEEVRSECIAKLSKFGAKTLPELKEENYAEFMDFLQNL